MGMGEHFACAPSCVAQWLIAWTRRLGCRKPEELAYPASLFRDY